MASPPFRDPFIKTQSSAQLGLKKLVAIGVVGKIGGGISSVLGLCVAAVGYPSAASTNFLLTWVLSGVPDEGPLSRVPSFIRSQCSAPVA
jgi:hypothetical protein